MMSCVFPDLFPECITSKYSPESVQKVTISYFHLSSPKPKPVPVYEQWNRDKRNISLLECWRYDVTFNNVNSCLKG